MRKGNCWLFFKYTIGICRVLRVPKKRNVYDKYKKSQLFLDKVIFLKLYFWDRKNGQLKRWKILWGLNRQVWLRKITPGGGSGSETVFTGIQESIAGKCLGQEVDNTAKEDNNFYTT